MALNWLWKDSAENRAESTDYSEKIIGEILARATGAAADSGAIAATEAAVGFISRSLSSAEVEPQNRLTAGVTPGILEITGRSLSTTGNALFVIQIEGGAVRLAPVAHWNVEGESDPASWRYRCDMAGPSRQRTRVVEAAGVVHFKTGCEISRPWMGRSALQIAVATGKLSASVEQSLTREQAFRPTRVVYSARGTEQISELLEDISRGGLIAENINEGDAATASKPPAAIGPEPGAGQVELRTTAARSVLSAFGLSASLFETGSDASLRESFRIAFRTCLNPLAMMISQELSSKLETPVTLSLDEIRAADSQGQARALASKAAAFKIFVTDGGMTTDQAREIAGI